MEAKLIKNRAGEYYLAVLHKNLPNWFNAAFELSDGYYSIASSINIDGVGGFSLLSLKNCQAIERGYDLDELVKIDKEKDLDFTDESSFRRGFYKALELMGDKKFSEEDIVEFTKWLKHLDNGTEHYNPHTKTTSESIGFSPFDCFIDDVMTEEELFNKWKFLQKNEWEVEVEMEWKPFANQCDQCGEGGKYMETPCDHPNDCLHWSPKLDADGCLILKRVV